MIVCMRTNLDHLDLDFFITRVYNARAAASLWRAGMGSLQDEDSRGRANPEGHLRGLLPRLQPTGDGAAEGAAGLPGEPHAA